jgi:hypothetical protein
MIKQKSSYSIAEYNEMIEAEMSEDAIQKKAELKISILPKEERMNMGIEKK